ncbi:MAG: DNA replication and repair protein RecF, partial [Lawsonibacter sp.]|nr:DNA replication and repair protein RecF [Lawsonibacter sp.]
AIHADFSGGREGLELGYETVSTVADPQAQPRELLPLLLEHQEKHRQAELDSRQCLSGPHKDDLAVSVGGKNAKTYASQGQIRTAALSLKLAQREIFQEETGEWPVLLLDDVLSELDPRRQAFVLNRIRGGQVFITCCEEEKLEGLEGGRAFHIQNGRMI